MRLTKAAERYCESRHVARTVVFSANRFVRFIADRELSAVSPKDLERFADCAKLAGLSPSTISGTIKDLRTLAIAAGLEWTVPRIKVPPPEPEPTPLDDINAIWPHLSAWSRQSVALMYWTCFRLDDILRLQCEGIDSSAKAIRLQAHKTGKNHAFPMPDWLPQYLERVRLPFVAATDHAAVIVRAELERVSVLAKVTRVYPRNIRQAGITAWSQANGMAGAIAHGSGLSGSVLRHYVSPLSVLESAAPRVRVPDAMRGDCTAADSEAALLAHFRRMNPAAQGVITQTAEMLAAG